MAEVLVVFGVISVLVILGYLSQLFFRKTGIPDVLLLIIFGIILGLSVGGLNAENFGFGAILFTNFALLFLIFQGSLSIDFGSLFRSLLGSLKIIIVSFILTVSAVTGISFAFLGIGLLNSILLGMVLGGTSSAVVIPMIQNLSIRKKFGLISILESTISDVLAIIGSITIIAIIKTGEVSTIGVLSSVLSNFLLALSIGVIVGLIWIFSLSRSSTLMDSYMVTIAIVIGLYAFVESPIVGASGPIAALAFGLMLGNSRGLLKFFSSKKKGRKKKHEVKNTLSKSAKNFYSEISFFIKVFFFIYLGILMDFSSPLIYVYSLVITLGIFLVRPLSVKISMFGERPNKKSSTFLEVLIPKGLAAAVLAQLALQEGLESAELIFSVVLGVIFISIVFSSILSFLTERGWFNGIYSYIGVGKRTEEKSEEEALSLEQLELKEGLVS